jgi:hypothetical protein
MKPSQPTWLKWVCGLGGGALIAVSGYLTVLVVMVAVQNFQIFLGPKGHATPDGVWMNLFAILAGRLVGQLLLLWLGIWLVRRALAKGGAGVESASPDPAMSEAATVLPPAPTVARVDKNRNWSGCNFLHVAPDAKRLWQFDAKGGGFALAREQRVTHTQTLPGKGITKSWSSLWQPKLNLAWLPPENVFLRVIELPAASAEETFSMVELQLEKLSPMPVMQVVWTMHMLGTHESVAKADGTRESLQTVVVVIVARAAVEEFLGRLEKDNFLADRLEVPWLDQLEAVSPEGDSAWIFPLTISGQNSALIAWWCGGVLRSLSFVTLHAAGDRAAELKSQLSLLMMAGEVEGWLVNPPRWHLVADPVNAAEWDNLLREALGESVKISAPPGPVELAARTARRAAAAGPSLLLPEEFIARYKQQFIDRLWLRGLFAAGVLYAVGLVLYFAAVSFRGYQTNKVEAQVAAIANDYTNAVQLQAQFAILKERAQLKYAALDCWQTVAQQLPQGITLGRFSFADGQRLSLSGSTTADQVNTLFDLDSSLRKAQLNGQPMFDLEKGTHVNPRLQPPNTEVWNMSVELLHSEVEQP